MAELTPIRHPKDHAHMTCRELLILLSVEPSPYVIHRWDRFHKAMAAGLLGADKVMIRRASDKRFLDFDEAFRSSMHSPGEDWELFPVYSEPVAPWVIAHRLRNIDRMEAAMKESA